MVSIDKPMTHLSTTLGYNSTTIFGIICQSQENSKDEQIYRIGLVIIYYNISIYGGIKMDVNSAFACKPKIHEGSLKNRFKYPNSGN